MLPAWRTSTRHRPAPDRGCRAAGAATRGRPGRRPPAPWPARPGRGGRPAGLTLAGGAGYRILEGQAHTILAAAYIDLGDHARAIGHARRPLALHRQTGHRLGYARALVTLGHVLRHTDDADAATTRWRQALPSSTAPRRAPPGAD